ncbi:MAG TPA: hemerythrin domain-containing protein [Bacteroidales bacterium]
MKTATQNLENDHVYILKLTEVMQKMAANGATDINHFKSVVNVIQNYADGLHHKKEEDLLFPLFEKRNSGGHCGPVGVMLMEHAEGREYVRGMVESIEEFEGGNQLALQYIHHNMLGYAELLQNHIYKENNILFRMADNMFSDDDQSMLLDKFDEIEAGAEAGSKIENYVAAIRELANVYLLSKEMMA